ncbi:siderophore-interacting protein [Agromyces cerinus]|uniref:NADPH-dependent ferric siderophore reductase, contains FAD-binding and SIP domains n=1 Tax=Agromyces cerinus subsp. cerinus TaxID=232089 RepID=A0A1N6HGP9_9MICO|nr:siderophore-interacting protein [Agromyces cerinus]SIO18933.1 NADPH-dependent ferric siderophore reductase, contains FAD-binding and SIP domains [Agromyces cerinus subsp. cerinus]
MAKPGYRVFDTQVALIQRMSPHFVRVTLRSDDLKELGWDGPDQRIKVVLPLAASGYDYVPFEGDWYSAWRALPDDRRNPIRTYTIREARPGAGELDVDFVAHGDSGPASRWIASARPGDRLLVIAPDATSEEESGGWEWRPGAARTLLIAGDETAVPAVGAILEQLPVDARGAVFLEVPEAGDALELRAPAGVSVRWLPRGDASQVHDGRPEPEPAPEYGTRLVEAVTAWADAWVAADPAAAAVPAAAPATARELPSLDDDELVWEAPAAADDGGLYAWLAGEASAITTLRRHLVKGIGVDRRRVAFMGYWKLGRAEG